MTRLDTTTPSDTITADLRSLQPATFCQFTPRYAGTLQKQCLFGDFQMFLLPKFPHRQNTSGVDCYIL